MKSSANLAWQEIDPAPLGGQRAAPRFTLLIRAARLVTGQGEFVCVIRDVSETGISIRLFHNLPPEGVMELHLPSGDSYEINKVWARDEMAGFSFARSVDVARIINEVSDYPKRAMRLGLHFPVQVSTLTQNCEAIIENLSQQGARFETDGLFAIDQALRLSSEGVFDEVRAKVRWRKDSKYGVVFDDTFTLRHFARLAARLQAPTLLKP